MFVYHQRSDRTMKRRRTGETTTREKKSEGRSSSPSAPPPQPRVFPPLQVELRRSKQLDAAIESHEAALAQLQAQSREEASGEAMSSSPADDRLRMEDDVERLKNELFDETVDQHQLQLLVNRLKLSWAAMGALFPRSSAASRAVSSDCPVRSVAAGAVNHNSQCHK